MQVADGHCRTSDDNIKVAVVGTQTCFRTAQNREMIMLEDVNNRQPCTRSFEYCELCRNRTKELIPGCRIR